MNSKRFAGNRLTVASFDASSSSGAQVWPSESRLSAQEKCSLLADENQKTDISINLWSRLEHFNFENAALKSSYISLEEKCDFSELRKPEQIS